MGAAGRSFPPAEIHSNSGRSVRQRRDAAAVTSERRGAALAGITCMARMPAAQSCRETQSYGSREDCPMCRGMTASSGCLELTPARDRMHPGTERDTATDGHAQRPLGAIDACRTGTSRFLDDLPHGLGDGRQDSVVPSLNQAALRIGCCCAGAGLGSTSINRRASSSVGSWARYSAASAIRCL